MNHTRRFYAILLLAAAVAYGQQIRLKARPEGRIASGRTHGTHVILQFSAYPGPALREDLTRRGVHVLEYVPDNALMVSAQSNADLTGLDVTWADSLSISDKISPILASQVSGPVLAIFHPDVPSQRARQIAGAEGFDVLANPGVLSHQLVLSGPLDRLPNLAAFDEVSYLLPASADLASGNPVAGCAGAVTEAGPIGEYVLVGRGWPKDASGKFALQYFIRNLTEKMDASIARAEIQRALREWTKYAAVTISPGQQGATRTIDILFGRGSHGDNYPFDGPGAALAHTFYPAPPNAEPIAGDMHLDADEPWRSGASIDLFSVALHEVGHALGLGHSDRPGNVMYPYYRQVTGLTDDDIVGIRALYGADTSATPVAPPLPPPTTPVQPPPSTDVTPPTVRLVFPAFTIVSTTAASIAFTGTAADNVGVTVTKWSTSTGSSGTASGTNSWTATIPLLIGTNVITIRAFDAAGNSGWRSVTVVRR